jgi:CCR4-NOT transcription complex subunit 4
LPIPAQVDEPTTDTTNTATATAAILQGDSKQAKEARKAAKKAAAAERAVERAKAAQERAAARAAEKTRLAAEKAEEKKKERAAKAMKEQEEKQRLEQEKTEKAKERAERAAKAEQEKAEREVAEQARLMKEQAEALRTQEKTEKATQLVQAKKAVAEKMAAGSVQSEAQVVSKGKDSPTASAPAQVPLLSKMPKKSRPVAKPIRIPKDDEVVHDTTSTLPSATTVDTPALPSVRISTSLEAIPSEAGPYSAGSTYSDRASLEELLDQIDMIQPWMNLLDHPFFDISKINPAAKMPLEYGPLVHALSALSVGGGSFANNMPSGSIDNAVSSFQQLLETLTQTISDLLRLLPRTTWDDSSSFDGVLRDMLKGDDFLDEGGEDGSSGRDDEVAALTLALERRARWMEVQLSKLEELHRDINTAAVRAVLSFNDRGWDKHGFLPRIGNSLARFDSLALVQEADGASRTMSADELEQKLTVANEAVAFAETELKESMEKMQGLRMLDDGF